MIANITFEVVVEVCDNQSMTLGIRQDSKIIQSSTLYTPGKNIISCSITTPCQLTLTLGNKSPGDTVVDSSGTIIKNKFIRLEKIILDKIEIQSFKLPPDIMSFVDSDGVSVTDNSFWDKNGTVIINIDHEDPVLWWLDHQCLW